MSTRDETRREDLEGVDGVEWWEQDRVPGVGPAGAADVERRRRQERDRARARAERDEARRTRHEHSREERAAADRAEQAAEIQARRAVHAARRGREERRTWAHAGDEPLSLLERAAAAVGLDLPMAAEQTPHRGTTANTAAIFPFYNEAGIGHRGPVIGLNVLGGGAFSFDPWNLYNATSRKATSDGEERIVKNGNMVVLGSPGEGKSSLVKTMAYRQAAFGRRCEFIDPKGEYADVVQALDGVVIRLEPGGEQALNPLMNVGDDRARVRLLEALGRALLGRSLRATERTGLLAALRQADLESATGDGHEVCLPHVEQALRNPGEELVTELNGTAEFAREELREVMLELSLLRTGPLAGMFDRPTTISASTWESDAIAIDLSAIASLAGADDEGQNKPLAITMMCCSAFLTSTALRRARRCEAAGRPIPQTIRVNDEGWRVLAVPGQAQQYQSDFKLQRATGVVNVVVMHRLSDLRAAGDDGTRAKKLAEGLRADADTIVIYRQDDGEMADVTEQLHLSTSEAATVRDLGQAQALWMVGKWRGVVHHLRSSTEERISNTDAAMASNLAGDTPDETAVAAVGLDDLDLVDDVDGDLDEDAGAD